MTNELDQLIGRAKSWLDDPFNTTLLRDESRDTLDAWVQDPLEDPMAGAAMGHLARWEAYAGLVAILEGEAEGWSTFTRSFYHHVWRLELILAHRDGTSKGNAERALIGGLLTAWATWWEADDIAKSFAERLTDRSLFSSAGEDFQVAEDFLRALPWREDPGDTGPARYPHADLLRYIHEGGSVPQVAFDDACDLHVSEALDEEHGAFRWTPWDLLPVELLAYSRLCEEHGRRAPELRHPIVRSAACRRRREAEPPDELRNERQAVLTACEALRQGIKIRPSLF